MTAYDGAGDNVAYQSGTGIFIANPGSVFLYMRNEDPELGAATKYSGLPGGPSNATMTFPVLAYFGLQSLRIGEAASVAVSLLPIFGILAFIVARMLQRED